LYFLQNLGIITLLNESHQLIKNLFNIPYFISICIHKLLFIHQSLLFTLVFPLKPDHYVLLLLL